jgi:hypothetical protein
MNIECPTHNPEVLFCLYHARGVIRHSIFLSGKDLFGSGFAELEFNDDSYFIKTQWLLRHLPQRFF